MNNTTESIPGPSSNWQLNLTLPEPPKYTPREIELAATEVLAERRRMVQTRTMPIPVPTAELPMPATDRLGLPTHAPDSPLWSERTESTQKHQTLQLLTNRHQEAARMAAAGISVKAIANELSVAPSTVANWLQDPKMELLTASLRSGRDIAASEAAVRICELQARAVETLAELLDKENAPAQVRLGAARDLLDRGGHAAPKQLQVSTVSTQLTLDDILELRKRLNGDAVDVSGSVNL